MNYMEYIYELSRAFTCKGNLVFCEKVFTEHVKNEENSFTVLHLCWLF